MTDRTPKDIVLDSLAIPPNIFEVFQGAHEGLASQGNDPDIVRIHCEIVELIQKMQEKYSLLLKSMGTLVPDGIQKH
jgi:hypothetical protein